MNDAWGHIHEDTADADVLTLLRQAHHSPLSPAQYTPEAIMGAGRRRQRNRRIAAGVGAGLAAASAGLLFMAVASPQPPNTGTPPARQVSQSPTPVSTPRPSDPVRPASPGCSARVSRCLDATFSAWATSVLGEKPHQTPWMSIVLQEGPPERIGQMKQLLLFHGDAGTAEIVVSIGTDLGRLGGMDNDRDIPATAGRRTLPLSSGGSVTVLQWEYVGDVQQLWIAPAHGPGQGDVRLQLGTTGGPGTSADQLANLGWDDEAALALLDAIR